MISSIDTLIEIVIVRNRDNFRQLRNYYKQEEYVGNAGNVSISYRLLTYQYRARHLQIKWPLKDYSGNSLSK